MHGFRFSENPHVDSCTNLGCTVLTIIFIYFIADTGASYSNKVGAGSRIRTYEGECRQIYSPLCLTALSQPGCTWSHLRFEPEAFSYHGNALPELMARIESTDTILPEMMHFLKEFYITTYEVAYPPRCN